FCTVVSPPAVIVTDTTTTATPDDHFAAGPDGRVTASTSGRVGSVSRCPAIRAGVILPAGIHIAAQKAVISAPDDHFAASPHCRVRNSAVGGAREVGWSPRIANTSARGIRYCGKGVIGTNSHCLIERSTLLF